MKNLFLVILLFVSAFSFGQGRNNTNRIFNVLVYGAKGDGQEHFTATISSGTASLACSDCVFTAADVGKVMVIDTAGGSGLQLVTTITAFTNSTHVTLNNNATTSVTNQRLVYGTDATAAIQKATNACDTAGGGIVWFPKGFYIIAGALQTSVYGVNPNCQIYIPSPTTSRDTARQIIFEGESGPNFIGNNLVSNLSYYPSKTGTVLLSTITGSGTLPSVIGTKAPATSFNNFNYNNFQIKNLNLLVGINSSGSGPSVGGINADHMATFSYSNIFVGVDGIVFNEPLPSVEIAGIYMPEIYSEVNITGYNSLVVGFKYGVVFSEHTKIDQVSALGCWAGFVPMGSNSGSSMGSIESVWCTYGIYIPATTILGFSPDSAYISIGRINTESIDAGHTGGAKWFNGVADIYDSLNYGRGLVYMHITRAFSLHANYNLIKVGATNLNISIIEKPYSTNVAAAIIGGVDGQIQYDSSGNFGATPNMVYNRSTTHITFGGGTPVTDDNHLNVIASLSSVVGVVVQNTNTLGQTSYFLKNNRNNDSSYAGLYYGGSTNASGNLFGVNRRDKLNIIADGVSNLGMNIGTLQSQPLILGTNNTNRLQIDGSGNFTFGIGQFGITEGTNGRVGQTTLVSGTKAITISGLTTSSRGFVTLVSQGGTVTTTVAYAGVCTSNTLTITALTSAGATDTTDTSVLNYFVIN